MGGTRQGQRRKGGKGEPAAPEVMEQNVPVDQKYVRFLIGTKGATIKVIREQTKAQVQVHDAPPGSAKASVYLKGTPQQVSDAHARVLQIIATADAPVPGKSPTKVAEPEAEATPGPSSPGSDTEEKPAAKERVKQLLEHSAFPHVTTGIGGVSGGGTGAVVGAVVGVPAALFTFGLSIPVCATVGATVGGATGAVTGRFAGLGLRAAASKYL